MLPENAKNSFFCFSASANITVSTPDVAPAPECVRYPNHSSPRIISSWKKLNKIL